ncbi:hypothetical protein ACFQ3L_03405 [Lacticaseibacillus jixianensis]|uniref:DUF3923 family protein n=1 Tax=Lacticaseibacillus jixianensis TaxID=2486012 RepID=A0ABW4B7E6_9LACO|nr:hypothetical protein [Lacticaseibacillus jixianensis]
MRKYWWLTVAVLWLLSIGYFIVYVNSPGLQMAVNASFALSILHGVMDLLLIGGGIALIAGLMTRIFRRH